MIDRSFAMVVFDGGFRGEESAKSAKLDGVLERLLSLGVTVVALDVPPDERFGSAVPAHLKRRLSYTRNSEAYRYTATGDPLSMGRPDSPEAVAAFVRRLSWEHGIDPSDILVISNGQDKLGALGRSLPDCMYVKAASPEEVLTQLERAAGRLERGDLNPLPDSPHRNPEWIVLEEGANPGRELEIEALLTVSNGYAGTRGSLFERGSPLGPGTLIAGIFDTVPGENPVPGLVAAPDWVRIRMEIFSSPAQAPSEEGSSGHFTDLEIDSAGCDLSSGIIMDNRRTLDMNRAMMWREFRHQDLQGRETAIQGFRFASQINRHLLVQCITVRPENYSAFVRIETEAELFESKNRSYLNPYPSKYSVLHGPNLAPGSPTLLNYTYPSGAQISFASSSILRLDDGQWVYPVVSRVENRVAEHWEFQVELGRSYRIERLVAVFTSRDGAKSAALARDSIKRARKRKIETHFRSHLEEWRRRWLHANIDIEGDLESERALRFSCYNLLSAANPEDEKVSIGARALTGNSYLGHVFWDTEIFMLPFFIYTAPDIARSLLMYRYHTLPGAKQNANKNGYAGAMYPWESADSGLETTPTSIMLPTGERIRVLTGEQEHHITADVAYTVWHYCEVTGDTAFLYGPGAEILVETARFWASRVTADSAGVYHIEHAIGPDEYHEDVADNFYTNEMARWNLRQAAWLVSDFSKRSPDIWGEMQARLGFDASEREKWLLIAEKLYRARVRDKVREQFSGYFDLEDHVAREESQPGGTDFRIFLDLAKLGKTQLIKQADVVMFLQLFRDQFSDEELKRNFEYYEARTLHGSSLSPAIYGLMASRTGYYEKALRYFRMAAEVDLRNNMGNASGGVHSAAQGGLWQTTVFGFAGLRASAAAVCFEPAIPKTWQALRFQILWKGQPLAVSIDAESVEVVHKGWAPVPIRVGQGSTIPVQPGQTRRWELTANQWQEIA